MEAAKKRDSVDIQLGAEETALLCGDLSKLTEAQRAALVMKICETTGVNPWTRPFQYIKTREGGLVLYATKACTEQLRQMHGVSLRITSREDHGDAYVVTAQATNAQGRVDESTGAVTVKGLGGENLCNALMKAETKAKRRVTLSICGLGILDESEIETIVGAQIMPPVQIPQQAQALAPAPAAPSASIFAKPDSEMKVAQELTDEATVRELGKKLGKLAGAVNMDLSKAGDFASLRRSYEEQLAKEPVRGHSPSTHGSQTSALVSTHTVEQEGITSTPEEGANPAPEHVKNVTPQDDTAQTKLVMDIMAEFCKPGMIELYQTIAHQFSTIGSYVGRNVEKYSDLSVEECRKALAGLKAEAESLANDDNPDPELLQKAQMACKDAAFMEKLKKSKAYTEASKTGTQAEAVRTARLAFAKATLGREFGSFSEMTNAELEKIITAAKNFAKGIK